MIWQLYGLAAAVTATPVAGAAAAQVTSPDPTQQLVNYGALGILAALGVLYVRMSVKRLQDQNDLKDRKIEELYEKLGELQDKRREDARLFAPQLAAAVQAIQETTAHMAQQQALIAVYEDRARRRKPAGR